MQVMPDWERLTAHIEADPESKEKLGWVREMYAFSVALALQGVKVDLAKPPLNPLIAQPPADATLGQAAMFHYTWGSVFQNAKGEKVWEFDKRAYTDPSIVTTVSSCSHSLVSVLLDARFVTWPERFITATHLLHPQLALLLCCA